MNLLKILSQIALSFSNLNDFDRTIEFTLRTIGKHTNVSRVYIFIDNEDGTTSNTFEWCNNNILCQITELQNVSYEGIPSWKKILLREGKIYSDNIEQLPSDIFDMLNPQGIISILVYPLFLNNKLKGFIGFDECARKRTWTEEELEFLNTVSGIISNAYELKIYHDNLINSENNFRSFFNSINDFFIVGDRNGKILHVNDALIKRLKYTYNKLLNMTILDLHPQSKRKEAASILTSMLNGESNYCPLELQDAKGNIIPVETRIWFGKWDNKDCIFGISKDLTKEQEAFQMFAKIFENNPSAMVISNTSDRKITKVNSAFLSKFGYSKEEVIGKTTNDLKLFVNAEKQKRIAEELKETGRIKDIELDIRRKDGNILNGIFAGEIIESQGKKSFLTVMADVSKQKNAENSLIESEKRFNLALEGAKAGLWDWDMINGKVYFSPLWKSMLGYKDHEVKNSFDGWKNLWNPEDAPKIQKAIDDYLNGKTNNYEIIHRLLSKNGDWRWIRTSGALLKNELGVPYRWVGTNTDITEEREKSEELERFFSVNLDLLCIADMDGNFLKVNNSWTDILGYSKQELENAKFLQFIHPEDIPSTLEAINKLSSGDKVLTFVNRYRCKDGSYHYIEWRSHPYGNLIYAAARDITERIESEKLHIEMSIRDPLTNVYNRRYIFERIETMISEYLRDDKIFSISLLDIDFFKKVNDNYGHQAGDFILREFTKSIQKHLRSYDLLGRYGGEEFFIVHMNIDKKTALSVIERILKDIRNQIFVFNDTKITFTFSAGISDCVENGNENLTAEKIIEKSDNRLYDAKRTGRNKIVIS